LLKNSDFQALTQISLKESYIFQLLIITVFFAGVIVAEFFIGILKNNFQIIFDSLHHALHLVPLAFSLFSTYIARKPKDLKFSYGYSRLEIISSFTNCCFLMFFAVFLTFNAAHKIIHSLSDEPHQHAHSEAKGNQLLIAFQITRLCIYFAGRHNLKQFSAEISPHSIELKSGKLTIVTDSSPRKLKKNDDLSFSPSSYSKFPDSAHYLNFYSIYLHMWIGFLTTACFLCVKFFPVLFSSSLEMLMTVGVLVYTIFRTKNVFMLSTDILLQGVPQSSHKIEELLEKVKRIDGVSRVESRYWAMSPSYSIIYLNLEISPEFHKEEIEETAKKILSNVFAEILVETNVIHHHDF